MSSDKIITSSVAGKTPTTRNLNTQQLGVNTADEKIYVNNGTEIVDVLQEVTDAAEAGSDQALADAKSYTDTEVAEAKSYTDTRVAAANAHTDSEISDLKDYTDNELANLDVEPAATEFIMTASERAAVLAANEENFAASGMVHMGKHIESSVYHPINEGLYTAYTSNPYANNLLLGSQFSNNAGESKTDFPVTHIAGVVSAIIGINTTSSAERNNIKLPPAPRGYDIYDSTGNARGTGKANLNLRTEIDPKYGDIASTDNEAASRAFEGDAKNGDFRDDVSDWTQGDPESIGTVTNGVLRLENGDTSPAYFSNQAAVPDVGDEYIVSGYCDNTNNTRAARVLLGSVGVDVIDAGEVGYFEISVTPTGSGRFILSNGSSTSPAGNYTLWSNTSFRKATEEVVTDRVDMFGLEQFDMVIKDDEIFDMVQSQSTTFGDTDVPTVESVRPDSFFAVYDGQTGITRGRCVKWSTLTDEQKRKVGAYMKERLWENEDGNITFTSIRQRSFAGAGNGDWENINPATTNTTSEGWLKYSGKQLVSPQGTKDVAPVNDGNYPIYRPTIQGVLPHTGVFTSAVSSTLPDSNAAYKGRCFFYVLGTVSRLNQGAYVPNLNESGTKLLNNVTGSAGGSKWYSGFVGDVTTSAQCFKQTTVFGEVGAREPTGSIVSTASGRPDGRFYDAIYADGLGGVVDYRLSAYEATEEDFSKAWGQVKSNRYRGLEKPIYTGIFSATPSSKSETSQIITVVIPKGTIPEMWHQVMTTNFADIVEAGHLVDPNGKILIISGVGTDSSNDYVYLSRADGLSMGDFSTAADIYILPKRYLNVSVSGEFTRTDVIGAPSELLANSVLKDGWLGGWIPIIPDGVGKPWQTTKKWITSINRQYTTDAGSTWTSDSWSGFADWDESIADSTGIAADRVELLNYNANANQTKVVYGDRPSVYGDEKGFGNILYMAGSSTSRGALVVESLIGKIPTGYTESRRIHVPTQVGLEFNGDTSDSWVVGFCKHTPNELKEPDNNYNNSPAAKILWHQSSNNGQATIGIQANELTWDTAPQILPLSGSNTGWTVGAYVLITSGDFRGYYRVLKSGAALTGASEWGYGADGGLYHRSEREKYFEALNLDTLGWGDSDFIDIAQGEELFVDTNGNYNRKVAHELALPIGWIKNRARTGTQVVGIDL